MTSLERRQEISNYLKKNKKASREELATAFNVSLMTISRDLKFLEEKGILTSTYGGIFYKEFLSMELQYDKKKEDNIEVKRKIAKEAFKRLKSNMTIILDAGTTTFELANLISKSNLYLNVITNDIYIALSLYKKTNIKVSLIGGELSFNTGSTQGLTSIEELKKYNVDISFIGTTAITDNYCLCCPSEIKMIIKQLMMKQANNKILLVDSSKFNKKKLYNVGSLEEFDLIITDYPLKKKKELIKKVINVK